MAKVDIGLINCPVCDFVDAHVRESDSKKPYVVCDECNIQLFTRGGVSKDLVLKKMRPVLSTAEEKKAPTAPAAPIVQAAPAAPKKETKREKKSIFDVLGENL